MKIQITEESLPFCSAYNISRVTVTKMTRGRESIYRTYVVVPMTVASHLNSVRITIDILITSREKDTFTPNFDRYSAVSCSTQTYSRCALLYWASEKHLRTLQCEVWKKLYAAARTLVAVLRWLRAPQAKSCLKRKELTRKARCSS
jgi:hypothetical protein